MENATPPVAALGRTVEMGRPLLVQKYVMKGHLMGAMGIAALTVLGLASGAGIAWCRAKAMSSAKSEIHRQAQGCVWGWELILASHAQKTQIAIQVRVASVSRQMLAGTPHRKFNRRLLFKGIHISGAALVLTHAIGAMLSWRRVGPAPPAAFAAMATKKAVNSAMTAIARMKMDAPMLAGSRPATTASIKDTCAQPVRPRLTGTARAEHARRTAIAGRMVFAKIGSSAIWATV